MDYLSNSLLLEILTFVPLSEIFTSTQQVDKRFHSIIWDEKFLRMLIAREIHTTKPVLLSKSHCEEVIKNILILQPTNNIKFRGFVTDGGLDDDHPSFWVHNMFKKSKNPYCCREQKLNANVGAVLRCTQDSEKERDRAKTELSEIIRRWLRHDGKSDDYKSSKIIKGFSYVYNLFNSDILAVDEESPEEFKRRLRGYMDTLNENVHPPSLRRYPDNPFILETTINYSAANNSSKVACFKEIELSRQGDFTCPVGSLVIFVSDRYVDVTSEEFAVFNNLKTQSEVEVLCSNHGLDHISSANPEEFYKSVEFYPTSSNLKPVLWIGFDNNTTLPFHIIPLHNWFSGVYLYVKLIYPHNRMREQHWVHDYMNIDCRYIKLKGSVIDLSDSP